MRLLKKKLKSIQVVFYSISAIVLFYFSSWIVAIFIQYPPARGDLGLIFALAYSIAMFVLSVSMAKKTTKTKFSKETFYFILLVLTISSLFFVLANLVLRLEISVEIVVTISVLVASPLSCRIAGYSGRTLKNRLKKLGFSRGITLATIFILGSMPIIRLSSTYSLYIPSTGYVLPNLIFQSTENTSSVKGLINSSGFFAQVPIYENRTYDAENIVELVITNPGNEPDDLHFHIASFIGDFGLLKHLELSVISNSERINVVNVDNGFVQCNEPKVFLYPNNALLLSVECTGTSPLTIDSTLGFSVSISHRDDLLQKINISLKAVE